MIFFRFWDRQNPIIFFSGPFRSFLNFETAKFCYNEWFDWSNISYHPMTSFITVLTTIVSGFISTCGNVFSCSCRPWFWYQDIRQWLKKKVEEELIGRFIRKIKTRGHAYCELCNKDINYASRGWKSLEQHLRKKLHSNNAKIRNNSKMWASCEFQ